MALKGITKARSCPAMKKVDNATLNRYFDDNVPVEKEKTTRIREEVLPDLDAILDYVNRRNRHYGKTGVRVGSSTQGLNVNVKGDVDCSVVFKLNPNEGEDHLSNKLVWDYSNPEPRFYGFKDPTQNDTSSLSDDLKIVETPYSLPSPEPGYYCLGDYSDFDPCYSSLTKFVFNGDLIPHLVKRKFRRLLLRASKQLGLKDDMKLSRISHGPALTFQAEVTSNGETHPVSIDLAVVIRARLPFLPEMGWPVTGKPWPPPDKIQSIMEKGINLVAKKPFYWQLSFAELEKELVVEIDIDGGCRKDVHRIMKSVYYTVCKKDPALSTYMLKNVWFLEMEKHADPKSWKQKYLAKRYYSCLDNLLMYVNCGYLPQYFSREINLLKTVKIWDIRNDVEKIRSFRFDTVDQRKRPANGPIAPQPYKKTKATAPSMHYISTPNGVESVVLRPECIRTYQRMAEF